MLVKETGRCDKKKEEESEEEVHIHICQAQNPMNNSCGEGDERTHGA
jgi:hypothetical protein